MSRIFWFSYGVVIHIASLLKDIKVLHTENFPLFYFIQKKLLFKVFTWKDLTIYILYISLLHCVYIELKKKKAWAIYSTVTTAIALLVLFDLVYKFCRGNTESKMYILYIHQKQVNLNDPWKCHFKAFECTFH
jgi:hypothetical protein